MEGFDFWLVLIFGIYFIVSSAVGLYNDFKDKGATRWWRWALDSLGLIVGIGFLCELFVLR